MADLSIELGEEARTCCDCCGKESTTVHGFVYRDGDAYAVYYAGWSDGHPERGITLAIAVGEWSEGATALERVSIGLEAHPAEREILFSVLNPDQSPWGTSELLGDMVQRSRALQLPVLKDVFEIGELIVYNDSRARDFLLKHGLRG